MRLDTSKDFLTGAMQFTLVVTPHDYETARLSPFDRFLIAECQTPDASIADKLLGLELIARRVEEASPVNRPTRGDS